MDNKKDPIALNLLRERHNRDDLRESLLDISRGFDRKSWAPNRWGQPGLKRGEHYDYEIDSYHNDRTLLTPVCEYAAEWFAAHVPAYTDRYGACGYLFTETEAKRILDALWRDGLYSDEDKAREENDRRFQHG